MQSELNRLRDEIKKISTRSEKDLNQVDKLLLSKPFAEGMYQFTMFIIDYYARVRAELKIDIYSFIIVQTVVSHTLYNINKKNRDIGSYSELETEWEKLISRHSHAVEALNDFSGTEIKNKLTISSICLVTGLPKETVRRKVNNLCEKNLLKVSKKEGIVLGISYKKVFREYVPRTVLSVAKLLKKWQKAGVLKKLLDFNP